MRLFNHLKLNLCIKWFICFNSLRYKQRNAPNICKIQHVAYFWDCVHKKMLKISKLKKFEFSFSEFDLKTCVVH